MHQIEIDTLVLAPQPEKTSRAQKAVEAADRVGDYKASVLVRVVASAFDLEVFELFHHSRSRAPIAATRQLAMYLMHVVVGRSLTEVGLFFGRDRTTVAYACMRMEDLRDDPVFDEKINEIEACFESVIENLMLAHNQHPCEPTNE